MLRNWDLRVNRRRRPEVLRCLYIFMYVHNYCVKDDVTSRAFVQLFIQTTLTDYFKFEDYGGFSYDR